MGEALNDGREDNEACLALTCSGQAALSVALAAICVRPGLRFAAEPWTFSQFIRALPLFGASAVPLQMDERGILPDSFEQVCKQGKIDALYTIPAFHNSLGVVMPRGSREQFSPGGGSADGRVCDRPGRKYY
jgi:DNA-binding transcriptional MocR family regulator